MKLKNYLLTKVMYPQQETKTNKNIVNNKIKVTFVYIIAAIITIAAFLHILIKPESNEILAVKFHNVVDES